MKFDVDFGARLGQIFWMSEYLHSGSGSGILPMSQRLKFIREFARRPRQTGAVAPSSPALAKAITDWVNWSEVKHVVEFGPGTGPITKLILQRLQPGARYLGIEANPALADLLKERFPGITVTIDKAANAPAICREKGIREVDAIISGLPFASFTRRERNAILRSTVEILRPGGYFTTFAYLTGLILPTGRDFRRQLENLFPQVDCSEVTWRNFPPAVFYRCRK